MRASLTNRGLLSTAALYLIGVPGALFLGIFTGLVCFVPLVGPVVSAVPPLVLAFAGNPIDALLVLLAYVAIQQIEGSLLTPLVMNKAASLHPAIVIASVTIAGTAFGVLGTLLAAPAMVVAGALAWAGLGAVAFSAVRFNVGTLFPGCEALLPNLGIIR